MPQTKLLAPGPETTSPLRGHLCICVYKCGSAMLCYVLLQPMLPKPLLHSCLGFDHRSPACSTGTKCRRIWVGRTRQPWKLRPRWTRGMSGVDQMDIYVTCKKKQWGSEQGYMRFKKFKNGYGAKLGQKSTLNTTCLYLLLSASSDTFGGIFPGPQGSKFQSSLFSLRHLRSML